MPEKTEKPKEPQIEAEYSTEFRRIVTSGVWGVITQVGLEAMIFSDEIMVDDIAKSPKLDKGTLRLKRTVEFSMLINPAQMKAIQSWLATKIKEYEHIFGEIPTDEEVRKKIATLRTSNKKK